MTNQTTVEADVTNEKLRTGLTAALQSLNTTLNEKFTQLSQDRAKQDVRDFLREVALLTSETAGVRFLPGGNTAEVISRGMNGAHNALHIVAKKTFSEEKNNLASVTVEKSNSAGTETFDLGVSGDSIVLERSRVDNDITEGGTWTRRWEM